jgi:hypothetical protein
MDDELLNRFQDNIERSISELTTIPILDGILLEAVTITTGDNKIAHKLGRKYTGYLVVKTIGAGSVVYESTTVNTAKDTFIILSVGSGTTHADIWIF